MTEYKPWHKNNAILDRVLNTFRCRMLGAFCAPDGSGGIHMDDAYKLAGQTTIEGLAGEPFPYAVITVPLESYLPEHADMFDLLNVLRWMERTFDVLASDCRVYSYDDRTLYVPLDMDCWALKRKDGHLHLTIPVNEDGSYS